MSSSQPERGRFRVLILGSLAVGKGLEIVSEIQGQLGQFADLYLVGCGTEGTRFEKRHGVTVIREYQWEELSDILNEIQPDLAVLPSVVPETFSFTLQELFELHIPTLATRLGSFSDRIRDGVNGFLCEPSAPAVLQAIRRLAHDREMLMHVRSNLIGTRHRTATEMLHDYDQLLASPLHSARSYFAPESREILRSATSTRCQVFWRSEDESFTESNSSSAEYAPVPESQLVIVQIPATSTVPGFIRVDPAEIPGVLDLQKLTLRGADGAIVWNWDGRIEGITGAFSHVVAIGEEGSVRLCFVNEDPHFELPLNESDLVAILHGGTLEIEIHWHRNEESIELLEIECAKANHVSSLTDLLNNLKKAMNEARAFGTADRAPIAFQLAEQRIKDLENSLSWRITRPLRMLADELDPLFRLVTTRWR